ncbi:MAG: hypothetical protein AABZ30_02245 [Myxococcota bacterium]
MIPALVAAALAQTPEALSERWLVLGNAHDTAPAAEAQATAIRGREHPGVGVVATDFYEGLPPGLHVVVFDRAATREDAYRRVTAVRNLGHRSWTRFSGRYVARPSRADLRKRRLRLALGAQDSVLEVVESNREVAGIVVGGDHAPALAVARPRRLGSDLVARVPLGPGPCASLRATSAGFDLVCAGQRRSFALGPSGLSPRQADPTLE